MHRREFALAVGAVMAAAGCTTDEPLTETGGQSTGADGGGETSPATDPTAGTATAGTATATPASTFSVGEAFTVGSGDRTVEYRVQSVDTYDALGDEYGKQTANGVWVVVVLEMTNRTDETVNIVSNHLTLVDEQGRSFDADVGATVYADSDPRIETEPIGFEQLNPGLSTSGVVLFDVNPGAAYQLLVEPLGLFSSAEPKRVSLGEITAPES